jgi:hypothetical protein
MKLDINFKSLENLVRNMGASSVDWVSSVEVTHIEPDWKITLETKGLDVGINDIEILSNGLLKFRDEQILLYIKEINSFGRYSLPKFHFYQCATLNSMKNAGRFERYVVTQRKTGYFFMDKKVSHDTYEKDVEEKLDVCKNCLNWFNRKYRKRYTIVTFDITEFFEHFTVTPITHKPTNTDVFSTVSNNSDRTKVNYLKPSINNVDNLQEIFSKSEKKPIIENHFNNLSRAVIEDYIEISPITNKVTSLELDIDENTQNFEDMF